MSTNAAAAAARQPSRQILITNYYLYIYLYEKKRRKKRFYVHAVNTHTHSVLNLFTDIATTAADDSFKILFTLKYDIANDSKFHCSYKAMTEILSHGIIFI